MDGALGRCCGGACFLGDTVVWLGGVPARGIPTADRASGARLSMELSLTSDVAPRIEHIMAQVVRVEPSSV